MSTKQTYLILLLIIVLAVLGFLFLPKLFKQGTASSPTPSVAILGGIEVTTPLENAQVSSPLKIAGRVTGGGWAAFEGQMGTVSVLDGNGKEVGSSILTAIGEWMKLPANFETSLQFTATPGTSGFLVFKNENASGEPANDKTYFLKVNFK